MSQFIARTCPRCREYLYVTIVHPTPESRELPISAWCAVCSYELKGWRLIVNDKSQADVRFGRMRKVFTQ